MQTQTIAGAASWMLGILHDVLPAAFASFARAAAPAAVAALWQGAVVTAVLLLCLRLASRITAAHRFTVWSAGFAVVAVLPFLPLFAHRSTVAASLSAPVPAAHPWLQVDSRWVFVIAGLWLAAAWVRAGQLAFHALRLRRLWKAAAPIVDDAGIEMLAGLASAEICLTHALDRPSVIGFFKPRILIPDWLYARLTPGELQHVVLHEAEHLRRRDDWSNLLQKLCLVFFPLNPALVWIDRRLSREREMACDEGVVRRTQAPRAYAACLTSLAERGLQRKMERHAEALSLAAWRRRPELVHRVHSILRRKQTLHPVAAGALLGAVICGLSLGAVELARCPQVVAFVAPQPATMLASAQPEPARAVSLPLASSGFRAIAAKAVLPGNPNVPAVTGDAPVLHPAHQATPANHELASRDQSAAPRELLIKATVPPGLAEASDLQSGRQMIVFTAWEQIETTSPKSHAVADYDTGSSAGQAAAAQSHASAHAGDSLVTRVTVTRLILKIDPAGAPAGSKSSRTSASPSGQPIALPLDNGWLVFQL